MDRLMLCKYDIDDIRVIFEDGTTSDILKSNVGSILIEKDFINSFFPILCINVTINRNLHTKIINNKDTVKFHVVIEKFSVKNDAKEISKTFSKTVIDNTFCMITDDVSPYMHDEIANANTQSSPEKDNVDLPLYLFIGEHLTRYRRTINEVLLNATMADSILYCAQLCGVRPLLMSDPDNQSVTSQTLIPPFTFIGVIDYLQKMYGIYNKGFILFNDFIITYLINKEKKCTALQSGEVSRVYINLTSSNDPNSVNIGSILDNVNLNYFINSAKPPTILNNASEIKQSLYDTIGIINTYTGKLTVKNLQGISSNNSNIHVFDDQFYNPYATNAALYDLEESSKVLNYVLDEVDLDIFTPNKEYYFNFDLGNAVYEKYNNIYKLCQYKAMLYKNNGEYFTMNIDCTFKSV